MSGELQTIPARHGVATFVPRGRTIKVINTYGKQVVSMWAFTLGAPPEEGDDEPGAEEIEEEAKKLQQGAEGEDKVDTQSGGAEKQQSKESGSEEQHADPNVEKEKPDTEGKDAKEEHEDPPEQAPDTPQNESTVDTDKTGEADGTTPKQPSKRTWASYLPSIPYRAKGKGDKADKDGEQEPSPEEQKAQNEAITKKWSSYIPTGKGFSNYIPNVEVPSKEGVVSAFKSSHNRDPNKSYAEQLYDFSKTPVGAGTIAAATGSGYASSVYAAYSAYAQTHPSSSSNPPMEYLSLPHTRSSSYKLVPEVSDTLLTNLRNPIITLVEDSTPGAHDTLTAACDANLYTALGVSQPAEHGSCAENLVLALKELNESAGLKGTKAVGADISVNIAPTPLHLFMAAPLALAADAAPGSGARGARIAVEEPKGRKRGFVRFRAERDVVVVLSACPMDVGPQNGGRCMAANFMVEEEADTTGKAETDKADKTGKAETDKADKTDKTNKADQKHKADKTDKPVKPEKTDTTHKTSKSDNPDNPDASDKSCASAPSDAAAKPKKKPKKLEVRSKP